MNRNAGEMMLDLAMEGGARSIAVVGTGKNVGKTVTVRALCNALFNKGVRFGLTSVGRDGEGVDAGDALAKPRLWLQSGVMLATARGVLPHSPACEIADLSDLMSAAGPVVYAAVRSPGYYEIAGPPTASGVREVVAHLYELGSRFVLVDGSVDRIAALAGTRHAVIVATGANAGTPSQAVDEVRALVARLSIPAHDVSDQAIFVPGAFTAADAARLIAAKEQRQIVVRDPTQVAIRGKAFLGIVRQLRLRCERPIRVLGVTVASIGRERYFEPAAFLRDVAAATGLPAFDVYAAQTFAA